MENNTAAPAIQTVFAGFTQFELDKAFESVQDPADWRAPIDSLCYAANEDRVAAAILYFTATKATFHECDEPGKVRVTALGYRMGPAN